MSLEDLRGALDALDEPAFCEGTHSLDERASVRLPNGSVMRIDDPKLVDWLVEHGEPAPFGKHGETRVDPSVRQAIRLAARGEATVSGFDVDLILPDIEKVLSPREHLAATLTDVVVYPPGGHFDRHRDTPTSPELVGTLVVGLPIEHAGGEFVIEDGIGEYEIDWSGPADRTKVRWVAMFSDVDHAVLEVESGARVTLVYALVATGRERVDPSWADRFAPILAVAQRLELADRRPIMIPCTRHVIGPDDQLVHGLDALRGTDRDIADALVQAGFAVVVRTCLAAREHECVPDPAPRLRYAGYDDVAFARLATPFLQADVEKLECCATFVRPSGDGGGYFEDEVSDLRPYLDEELPHENWLVRRTAAATLLCDIEFATDGYVGNCACDAYLYKLAALEVSRRAGS